VDSAKLQNVLRVLENRGWFVETNDSVFANARPAHQLLAGSTGWKSAWCAFPLGLFLTQFALSWAPQICLVDALVDCTSDYLRLEILQVTHGDTISACEKKTKLSLYDYLEVHPQEFEDFGVMLGVTTPNHRFLSV